MVYLATIPASTSDVLLHLKDSDRTERVILPFTRYANIMSAPNVVTDGDEIYGAPFHLLHTKTEVVSADYIRRLCGRIL